MPCSLAVPARVCRFGSAGEFALSPEIHSSHRARGIIFAFTAGVLWSLGGLLIKSVDWTPLAIAGARSGVAALVFLAFLRRPHFTWSWTQIGAAIAYCAAVISFVAANKLTTAANAILLQYTAPIYAALLGWWLLNEKVVRSDWITIAAVTAGMALFFLDKLTLGGMQGNLLAMFSGVAFAVMATLLRKQRHGSPAESLLLGNILTFLVGIPAMIDSPPTLPVVPGILLLGTLQLGLSYVLYAEAMKHITTLEGMLVPTIEPILNPIWVMLLLHETPGPWAIAGGMVVLAAVTGRAAAKAISRS
jgi:drug/metabolite transporter (DMT)-like permease